MDTTIICRALLLLLLTFTLYNCEAQSSSEEDEFVPTHEWQVVREGQVLPKGLHIRINLKTGEKQAKLLDSNEDKTKSVLRISNDDNTNDEKSFTYSENALKKALKNIKSDETTSHDKPAHTNQFRSYEQLKQDLSDLNLNPKTDSEVLKNLVAKFKKLMNVKKVDVVHVLSVMEDIDFLIHHYDNAIEFVRLKGFEEVIYKNLNSSVIEVKRECLKLLGSLVQNNAKVQIHALETGSLDFLLRILVLNSDATTKNRAIFALGSLMRRFPLAQLKFLENAGLSVFYEIASNANDIKIQLKIVTLINDLVLEHIEALDYAKDSEKVAQYSKIDLKVKLSELDWCKYLTTLLKNIYEIDKNDHDGLEKSLNAILSIVDDCKTSYINNIQDILQELQLRYSMLAVTAGHVDDGLDSDYCKHMETLCSAIINYNNIIKKIKTEL